jgi:hypothetical protein
VRLDQANGKLTVDDTFHDQDGQPGFNFDNRTWPQGWTGSATRTVQSSHADTMRGRPAPTLFRVPRACF